MSGKLTVADTVPGVAKALRQMAELTAKASQNWNNYEHIVLEMLNQVYEAGKTEGARDELEKQIK